MSRGEKWTVQQMQILYTRFREGKKYREIAQELGKTQNAVTIRGWASGLRPHERNKKLDEVCIATPQATSARKWTPEEDLLVRTSTESIVELAKKLQRTPTAIYMHKRVLAKGDANGH